MAKKKTSIELEAEIKDLEKRLAAKRAAAKKVTEAEVAKRNAAIVSAVLEWRDSLPKDKSIPVEKLPEYFHELAEENRKQHVTVGDDDDEFII